MPSFGGRGQGRSRGRSRTATRAYRESHVIVGGISPQFATPSNGQSLSSSTPMPLHFRPFRPIPKLRPTRTIAQRFRADARTTFGILFFFASWFPAWSFFTNNVFCIMSVTGPSMAPFLNTDYNSSLVSDRVWVNMWRAGEGLKRGMVVAYRYVYLPA